MSCLRVPVTQGAVLLHLINTKNDFEAISTKQHQ